MSERQRYYFLKKNDCQTALYHNFNYKREGRIESLQHTFLLSNKNDCQNALYHNFNYKREGRIESSQHTFLLSNAILLKLQYFILIFLYFHIDTFFLCRKCMKCLKAVTCSEMVAICDFISLSWV